MQISQVQEHSIDSSMAEVLQKINYLVHLKRLKVLTLQSQKRREGKSHLSLLLAKELARIFGMRVAIFDINLEGDDLINSILSSREGDQGTYSQVYPGVDIIQVKDIALKIERAHIDTLFFNRILTDIKDAYSLVLIDSVSPNNEGRAVYEVKADGALLILSHNSIDSKLEDIQEKYMNRATPLIGVLYNEINNER